jgi:hypothetical protein
MSGIRGRASSIAIGQVKEASLALAARSEMPLRHAY